MGEPVIGRMIVPARHHFRPGPVRNVENDHPAVDIAEIGAVGALWIDVCIVRAEAGVGAFRMTHRRRLAVALSRARQPPAADLDRLRRVLHVDDPVELVILGVGRREVRRAGAHVDVFAIGKPQLMNAARMGPGAIEERDRTRGFRHRDVEQLEPRGLQPLLFRLIGDRHDVADRFQRIRAHMGLRQIGPCDDFRGAWIADIDGGKIFRRALVSQPQDAAPVLGDLDRHALANAAEPVELVMCELPKIPNRRLGHVFSPLTGASAATIGSNHSPHVTVKCPYFSPGLSCRLALALPLIGMKRWRHPVINSVAAWADFHSKSLASRRPLPG